MSIENKKKKYFKFTRGFIYHKYFMVSFSRLDIGM